MKQNQTDTAIITQKLIIHEYPKKIGRGRVLNISRGKWDRAKPLQRWSIDVRLCEVMRNSLQ